MKPNAQLRAFYETLKRRAPSDLSNFADLVGPELIWLDDEYLSASPRIAIIGQQIDGWEYSYADFITKTDVEEAIGEYRDFDFAVNYRSSPFWQFFHQVRACAFADEPGARRRVLWMNLVKLVASDKTPIFEKCYAERAFELQSDIFPTELAVARPDVCLFVTGPCYDRVIERYFAGVRFEAVGMPARTLARLEHHDLPSLSFRTYHPKALRLLRRWKAVMQALGREIGRCFPWRIGGSAAGRGCS